MVWQLRSSLEDRPDVGARRASAGGQSVGTGSPLASTRKGGQPAIGTITPPLAALLHRRQELREAVAAADLIDSAIRDGA